VCKNRLQIAASPVKHTTPVDEIFYLQTALVRGTQRDTAKVIEL
jgi:hypothetical protein